MTNISAAADLVYNKASRGCDCEMENSEKLSETIIAAKTGDRKAAAELMPLLYGELRTLGRVLIGRQPPGQTLQATALVHEAYAKLIGE